MIFSSCGLLDINEINPQRTKTPQLLPQETERGDLITPTATDIMTVDITPTLVKSDNETTMRLTYIAEIAEGSFGVYSINLDCLTEITPCIKEPELLFMDFSPGLSGHNSFHWSPDGTQLAISAYGKGQTESLFIADWNGKNPRRVTDDKSHDSSPNWSGNGESIAYHSCDIEGCKILRVDPTDSTLVSLVAASDVNDPRYPAWMPDGNGLMFTGFDETMSPSHVYISNLDGSSVIQLTNEQLNIHSPSPSPDGEWVTFSMDVQVPDSFGDVTPNIYIMRTDGTNIYRLVEDTTAGYTYPVWSPLGNWIAFNLRRNGGDTDLYIVKPDGSQLINITNTPNIMEWQPEWRVVYNK